MQRLAWPPWAAVFTALLCALALPATASADTITLAWDPSPDSRVLGYVMYVDGPSGYSRSFDVGPNAVFQFSEALTGQRYCFAVASYVAGPTIGSPSAQVCGASSGNVAPVLEAPGDRTSAVGESITLQLNGADPNGQAVTYASSGLPPGVTLQQSTGFISGTPTATGVYPVVVTVLDGALSSSRTFTWTIVAASASATTGTLSAAFAAPAPSTVVASGSALAISSLTASLTAPQPAGTTITFTASVTGGVSPQQFKWWLYDGSKWSVSRDWTTNNTWSWTPAQESSAYRVGVWVRNATSTSDAYENNQSNWSMPYPIEASRAASSSTQTSTSALTSSSTLASTSSNGLLTLTTISADRVAPQPVGTSVTFTASAVGGSAPYQYKWWIYDGATWVVSRDWGTANSWTWTPGGDSSAYRVGVWVRSAGRSTDAYDNPAANGSMPFPIIGSSSASTSTSSATATSSAPSTGGTLTLTAISASRPLPLPVGVPVTYTAAISGGRGPQMYKWWAYDGATWSAMTGWSTSNTWTHVPPTSNAGFRVGVWVRNAGSTDDTYDNPASNGSIPSPVD